MPDKFDVKKVASLAKLKLEENEIKQFQDKFSSILGYIDLLKDVDTDQEAAAKDESLQQIYRKDESKDSGVSPEQFSDYVVDRFFKVPRVIE